MHRGVFKIPSDDVPAIMLWSFNQGFSNLFLAAGTIFGIVAVNSGNPDPGVSGSFGQAVPPLVAIIAMPAG